MSTPSLRIASLASMPGQTDALVQLLHDEWSDFAPWAQPSVIAARLRAGSGEQAFPHTLVALGDDGTLLGTASLKLHELPAHPDKTHWIGEVLIPHTLRGRGIGTALIRACLDYCARHGIADLHLYTPDQQALYRRLGWHDVQQDEVNGEMVTIMKHRFGSHHGN